MESTHSLKNPVRRRDRLRATLLRIGGAITATVLTSLLVIAWTLQPDSSGLGTHHQLGLPPCSIRVIFGIRCPSCGMTTSWSHVTHGNFVDAARANVGGLLLAVYALACIGSTVRMTLTGRMPGNRSIRHYTISLFAIAMVTLADWGVRLSG